MSISNPTDWTFVLAASMAFALVYICVTLLLPCAVARAIGLPVAAVNVGFGSTLVDRQPGIIRWRIKTIPLGGSVEFAPTARRDARGRLAIVFAVAALTPFALALFLFASVAATTGVQDLAPIIGGVRPGEPAARAGIQSGDRVLAIGLQTVRSFSDISKMVQQFAPSGPISIAIERDGERRTISVQAEPVSFRSVTTWRIGISANSSAANRTLIVAPGDVGSSISFGVSQMWEIFSGFAKSVGGLFSGQNTVTGGYITMAVTIGSLAKIGVAAFTSGCAAFTALLGCIALVPLPPFTNTGQLAVMGWEAMNGELTERAWGTITRLATLASALLLALFLWADYQHFLAR